MKEQLMVVHGSGPLKGEVSVDGAKNSVLVLMATTLLVDGTFVFENVPVLEDVIVMAELLRQIGSEVIFDRLNKKLVITTKIKTSHIPADLLNKLRASILVLAPILARTGIATFSEPGGCNLGKRPLDYHYKALEKLGVQFTHASQTFAKVTNFSANKIVLDYPSVGATETALLAAVNIAGHTTIVNAALEPEVLELVEVLKIMGAKISYQIPATIIVEGGFKLQPFNRTIMPDRLEAGSLILAALITNGQITLKNVRPTDLELFLEKISEMGHEVTAGTDTITCKATSKPKAVSVRTAPYPGFPTDLLSPMMSLLCLTPGESFIEEGVFDDRLNHVPFLNSMGADINLKSKTYAHIFGVAQLVGADVEATNIRSACALVLAGLTANGITTISNVYHWYRGYGEMLEKLQSLGANISVVDKQDYFENFHKQNLA